MEQGIILRIERISPHDGQGLRTVVFFKGCPLRCKWCSTPESQSLHTEWFYKQTRCLHCGNCIPACPQSALSFSADKTVIIRDQSKCVNCFKCTSACLPGAIGAYGRTMTVAEVIGEVQKDSLFYFYSDGGVTLSGGDILFQADYARKILKACQEDCINTAAELDMYGSYENVAKVLEYLDSCFVDIKLMDSPQHKRWVGKENTSILENTLRASADFPHLPLFIRVPLIPGINDTLENICQTAAFCQKLPTCKSLDFLPYHRLGAASYQSIGRPYEFAGRPSMTDEEAYQRIVFLKNQELPFIIKISGKTI